MTVANEPNEPKETTIDVAALMAENERLKSHHSKLLEETKTAKQKSAELEKAQQDAEIARQQENGEYKTLAERYKAEVEAERKALVELKGSIANQALDSAAMQAALGEANSPANAKIMARFIRDQLEYSETGVIGKGGKSPGDAIKELFATGDFESLRKGNQASGGGAIGSNAGGCAAKGNLGGTKSERKAALAARFPDLLK
ncbi:MAG: hypothetical protein ACRCUH_10265 [Shewanella sp.]